MSAINSLSQLQYKIDMEYEERKQENSAPLADQIMAEPLRKIRKASAKVLTSNERNFANKKKSIEYNPSVEYLTQKPLAKPKQRVRPYSAKVNQLSSKNRLQDMTVLRS